jgi:Fe-S cluster assembly protein SufD
MFQEQLPALFEKWGKPELAQIAKNGSFPNRKVESWKYTPVQNIQISESEKSTLNLPFEGILLEPNTQAEGIQIGFEAGDFPRKDIFDDFANESFQRVLTVTISRKFKSELPLIWIHQPTSVSTDCIKIIVEEGATANFVELYQGNQQLALTYSNILVEGKAIFNHYQFQFDGFKAGMPQVLSKIYAQQHAQSTYQHTVITFDGSWVRNELNVTHLGEHLFTGMNGLYVADGNRLVDNHTNLEHAKPNGESSEFYKGIAMDRGQAVFNGRIHVFQDAQKTNAFQNNQNLLLSNEAQINAKPQLEIFADDVKCSHGATVGKLRQDEIFYLQSRGLSKETATQLLTNAFGAEVIEKIENEILRSYCLEAWNNKMGI